MRHALVSVLIFTFLLAGPVTVTTVLLEYRVDGISFEVVERDGELVLRSQIGNFMDRRSDANMAKRAATIFMRAEVANVALGEEEYRSPKSSTASRCSCF